MEFIESSIICSVSRKARKGFRKERKDILKNIFFASSASS